MYLFNSFLAARRMDRVPASSRSAFPLMPSSDNRANSNIWSCSSTGNLEASFVNISAIITLLEDRKSQSQRETRLDLQHER